MGTSWSITDKFLSVFDLGLAISAVFMLLRTLLENGWLQFVLKLSNFLFTRKLQCKSLRLSTKRLKYLITVVNYYHFAHSKFLTKQ